MIIVRLSDGLGNQMFQYALGRTLALRHGVPLRLDTSAYRTDLKRRYALDLLSVEVEFLSQEEAERVITRPLDRSHPWWDQPVVREPHFHYAGDIARVPSACYLIGYWQSERYFGAIADRLRTEFQPRAALAGRNAETAADIAATNAVCLHFRRGDYITDPAVVRLHGSCTIDYYRAAILDVARHVPDPTFFVFSDEPDWVRDNLRLAFPMRIVDHNAGAPVEDLRLMSLCRHHIIANSSFGWWAAWLGRKPGQRVCAPERWFSGYPHDTRDLTPPGWLRLPG